MALSDFTTNSNGPILMGMGLAVVVLVGFIFLGTLSLDERFQGGESITRVIELNSNEIEALQNDLLLAQYKLSDYALRERQAQDYAKNQGKLKKQSEWNANLKSVIDKLQSDIDGVAQAHKAYINQYREIVRGAAAGDKIDELTTRSGKTYHGVQVRSVAALGMSIIHATGSCRIPGDDLPLDMQELYQFGDEEAKIAAKNESENIRRYHLAREAAERAALEEKAHNDALRKGEDAIKKDQTISAINARLYSINDEITALESRIFRERFRPISRAPQMREQVKLLEKTKRDLEASLYQLRTSP